MKKILSAIAGLLFTVGLLSSAYAQVETTMPFMNNIQQSVYSNPTLIPEYKVQIGLPIISNLQMGLLSSSFAIGDLYKKVGDTAIFSLANTYPKLKDKNYLHFGFSTDLFSLRVKIRNSWWMVNVSNKADFRLGFSSDFVKLAWGGNGQFIDQNRTADLSNTALNMVHYNEIGLGLTKPVGEKWVFGGRINLLFGLSNVYASKSNVTLRTDTTAYQINLATDYKVNYSTGSINKDSGGTGSASVIKKYFTNFNNVGASVNLGAAYKPNEKWQITAGVNDLGFIHWKSNVNNYTGQAAGISLRGETFDQILAGRKITKSKDLADTARKQAEGIATTDAYNAPLTVNSYLMATFLAQRNTKFGAGIFAEYYLGIRPAYTLNLDQRVGRSVNLAISYTVRNSTFNNVGLALMIKPGPLQYYIAMDNALALNNGKTAQSFNLRTGLNFVFGKIVLKDSDKDGIPDKNDNCPDQPGLKVFNGCPDTDKDGIMDKEDACPDLAGTAEFKGCPDTDKDGIPDNLDECPDNAGLKEFGGCPDRDKDGIPDLKDACPDTAGTVEMKGCPDRDGDKIIDSKDKCPDQAGTLEMEGCPDRDKDGVRDAYDKCPDKPGVADHFGCPDTDADGVFDDTDQCPDKPGKAENNGCPLADTDSDGLLDKDDKCPNVAGPLENQGCPWGDEDKDGVLDNVDNCPTLSGEASNKGCPFGDSDGDGVKDNVDGCPLTPGTVANNGCPELKKEEVKVLKTAFANLEFETGRDVIKASSFPSLDELAGLLKARSTFKLKISGHTDNVGGAKRNMELSRKRAQAVKKYLAGKGVEDKRLKDEWFGSTKPKASNKTPQGRKINRRVEMKVIFD